MKDLEMKNKFLELRVKGMSFNKIAKHLNTSKQTLINWGKECKYEINNLKAIELETLYEKYYMTKKERIELFGEKVKEIKAELEKRKLSDLKTSELFNLFAKYDTTLQKEKTATTFKKENDTSPMLDFDKSTTEVWEA